MVDLFSLILSRASSSISSLVSIFPSTFQWLPSSCTISTHTVISVSFQRNHRLSHLNNPPLSYMLLQLWFYLSVLLGESPLEEGFTYIHISSYSHFTLSETSSYQALFPPTSQNLLLSWSPMTLKLSTSKVNLSLHFILTSSKIYHHLSFIPS